MSGEFQTDEELPVTSKKLSRLNLSKHSRFINRWYEACFFYSAVRFKMAFDSNTDPTKTRETDSGNQATTSWINQVGGGGIVPGAKRSMSDHSESTNLALMERRPRVNQQRARGIESGLSRSLQRQRESQSRSASWVGQFVVGMWVRLCTFTQAQAGMRS